MGVHVLTVPLGSQIAKPLTPLALHTAVNCGHCGKCGSGTSATTGGHRVLVLSPALGKWCLVVQARPCQGLVYHLATNVWLCNQCLG